MAATVGERWKKRGFGSGGLIVAVPAFKASISSIGSVINLVWHSYPTFRWITPTELQLPPSISN